MIFNKLPLYRPKNNIRFPVTGDKNVCLAFLSENSTFLDSYNYINYGPLSALRFIFVPTTTKPITKLTSSYKKALVERKLRPVKGYFGDFSSVFGKNFYMDLTTYLNAVSSKFNLKRFNTGRGFGFVNQITDTLSGVPEDMFERVLLYSVNLDKPFSESIIQRKFFPIFRRLKDASKGTDSLPFDKIIYHVYDHSSSFNILLYDKSQPINIGRIKAILSRTQTTDIETEREEEKETISIDSITKVDVVRAVVPKAETTRLKDNIKSFLNADPAAATKGSQDFDPEELAISALAYSATGDIDKSKTIAKQLKDKDDKVKQRLIRDLSKNLVAKPKPISISRNKIVSIAKPTDLIDNQSPAHIIDKRKRDFKEILRDDLKNVFKPFENEQVPIRVKSMKVEDIASPPSELKPTLKERYSIELIDGEGKSHSIEIDLPKITENGTFMINGQPKVLVNQMIPYPIFFFKEYSGRLETVYATVSIHSKKLARTAYLICHIGGLKNPLIMLMAYKYGFVETMKLFGIKYQLTDEKADKSYRVGNQFISFTPSTEAGTELVESFIHSMSAFPANGNVEDSIFWRDVLIKANGTRNCIYSIDQVWKFIVTPVEAKILAAKGDPVTLPKIFK
ncbi:MAG: hypothetical protein KAS32_30855, partial [Candidatus Peribacteraceae bacterium]|nr:hypothetical protein [Candidatus Peribacteraceae bacterium]